MASAPPPAPASAPPTPAPDAATADEAPYSGCAHYKRQCQLLAPCCDTFYACRFCHDEARLEGERDPRKAHALDRKLVRTVKCMRCGLAQPPQQACAGCHTMLGSAYFCSICVLFDNDDKEQFHCTGCGICRVGGRSNYFHCDRCAACLPLNQRGAHKCIEDGLRNNCPICMDDLATSRQEATKVERCGHFIHAACLRVYLKSNYRCPSCQVSIVDMHPQWRMWDHEVAMTPLPPEYRDRWLRVHCNDCGQDSDTPFTALGLLKCRAPKPVGAEGAGGDDGGDEAGGDEAGGEEAGGDEAGGEEAGEPMTMQQWLAPARLHPPHWCGSYNTANIGLAAQQHAPAPEPPAALLALHAAQAEAGAEDEDDEDDEDEDEDEDEEDDDEQPEGAGEEGEEVAGMPPEGAAPP